MSFPTPHPDRLSVVGFDPGSTTLGIAAIEFDCQSLAITGVQASTYHGERLPSQNSWGVLHGDRHQRIWAHRDNAARVLRLVRPHGVACEAPYYSKRSPNAFGPLMEVVEMLRGVTADYDDWLEFTLLESTVAKKAVGAKIDRKAKDKKTPVKLACLALPELNLPGGQDLSECDEHSIDALAVAYALYLTFKSARLGR